MRYLVLTLLLVGGLQLSGCAQYYARASDVTERVNNWVHDGEYAKALNLIAQVKPSHPDYATLQAKLPAIQRAADTFEGRTISEAQRLTREEQWQQALDTYNEGLSKLPDSQAIDKARTRFLRQRKEYLRQLDIKLLISQAQYLSRDQPLREEIAQVDPHDRKAGRRLKQQNKDVKQAAQELVQCGQSALDQQDTYLAYRCLSLANRLDPNETTQEALSKAEQLKSREDGRRRHAIERKLGRQRAQRTHTLLKDYKQAFNRGDLLHARDLLEEAHALQPDNTEINRLVPRLNREIKKQVQNGIEQGRRQYTLGHIQRAVDIWTSLRRLDPENKQLNEHIDRAQRVLDNLQAIEQRGPSIQLPGN